MSKKFRGAVAISDKVYFVPFNADCMGEFFNSGAYLCSDSVTGGGMGPPMDGKFSGAVVKNDNIFLVPYNSDYVYFGDNAYLGDIVEMDPKFAGAAVVGDKTVFAPYNASCVGVYQELQSFLCVSTGSLTTNEMFVGAAAIGDTVVFAPWNADCVGTFAPVVTTTTVPPVVTSRAASSGLSTGAIVGIAVGGSFGAVLVGYVLWRGQRQKRAAAELGRNLLFL